MARDWCLGRTEAEWLVDLIENQDEMLHLADELRELFGMRPRDCKFPCYTRDYHGPWCEHCLARIADGLMSP
jgi:hypothetical protein